jgi:NAD(P)-dependent dehydrogenase (short-subunit alcohol dehydrogenase family)
VLPVTARGGPEQPPVLAVELRRTVVADGVGDLRDVVVASDQLLPNSVAPGPTRTRISHDAFERFPEVARPLAARTTLGRIGEADDIGAVIAFLLSDEARWVTAQDLEVSGGFGL